MKVADATVAVAAFAPWHEHHVAARRALSGRPAIVTHAAYETFSVLTRLPEPNRVQAIDALGFLEDWFAERWIGLSTTGQQLLLRRLADAGIRGGAIYDALIAATVAAESATLVTADRRARATYERVGVDVQYVG